jgi:FtsH-binding integral membrane protein
MAEYDRTRAFNVQARSRAGSVAIDEGLRAYMIRVYNYMGIGLVLTGIVAYAFFTMATTGDPSTAAMVNGVPAKIAKDLWLTSIGVAIYASWFKWVIAFSPLIIVFLFAARINQMSTTTAQAVFWLFAALMGLSLSSIFAIYTGASITRIFFITAATFGAVSVYGYTTKRDLTQIGSFLIMGVIGLVIASVVNAFLGSTGLQFAISVLAVLIFTGLTAYDTQQLKDNYYSFASGGEETLGRSAIMGALSLYLDFINIFIALLQLFGDRR